MKFSAPVPILRIFDDAKAREFYLDFLGFSVVFEHRFSADAPLYMAVRRDGCELHLSEHFGDATPGAACRVEVGDVDAFCAALKAKAYKHSNPSVEVRPWGERATAISDPFGNRIHFFTSTAPQPL